MGTKNKNTTMIQAKGDSVLKEGETASTVGAQEGRECSGACSPGDIFLVQPCSQSWALRGLCKGGRASARQHLPFPKSSCSKLGQSEPQLSGGKASPFSGSLQGSSTTR
jgi:hypothetical protein